MAKIPIILEAGRADGKLIKTDSIYDDNQEKFLSNKIKEIDNNHNNLNNTVNNLTDTVNNNELDIENKLEAEKTRATNAENNLRETINNITEINENATSANIVTIDNIPNTSSSNVQQALNELFEINKELNTAIKDENNRAEAAEQANTQEINTLKDKTKKISRVVVEDEREEIVIEDNNGNEVFHLDENGLDAKNLMSNGKDVLTEHQDISMLATKEEIAGKQDVIPQIGKRTTSSINSDYIFASDDYDEEQREGEKYACINELGISAKGFYDLDGNNVLKKDIHLTVETQDLQSVRESNTVCTINNSSAYDVETSKDSILLSIEETVVAGSLLSFFLRIDSKYQEFGDITIFGLNENKLTIVTETIHYNAPTTDGSIPCISMPLREYYRVSLLSKSSNIKYIKIKLNNNEQSYLIRVAKKVEVNNKFSVTPVLIIQDGGQYMTPITDDGETYTNHWDWMVSKNIPFACAIALSRWNLPTRMEDIPEDASESYRNHVWNNRVTNELRNIVKNGKADFITYNGDLAPFAKINDFGSCISKNIEQREAIGIWSYGIVNAGHAFNENLCKCYLGTGYKWYRAPHASTCIGGIKYENTVTPVRTLHITSVLDENKFWGIPTIVWSHGIARDTDVIGEPIHLKHYKHLKYLEEEGKIKLCTLIEFENFFK